MKYLKYIMRIVTKIRSMEPAWPGKAVHYITMECGHKRVVKWNYRTRYIEGHTKSRCYECLNEIQP